MGWTCRSGRKAKTRRLPKRASAELKAILEALIFASPEPLTPKAIYKILDTEPKEDVQAALRALKQDYERPGGLQLVEVAGGYQIVTRQDLHEWVRRLFHERTTQKLSVQALETLAVIAYKQPLTALEVSEIRGVNTSGVLNTLLERHLDEDRRPQAGRWTAVHVRHDQGVPDSVRFERPGGPAAGRGYVRGARAGGRSRRCWWSRPRRGDAAARGARSRCAADETRGVGSLEISTTEDTEERRQGT